MKKENSPMIRISTGSAKNNIHLADSLIIPVEKEQDASNEYPFRFRCGSLGLCTAGECRLTVNLREYTLTRNDFLFVGPGSIVQFHCCSDNFLVQSISFSTDYIDSTNFRAMIPFYSAVIENPQFRLTEDEATVFKEYISLLQRKSERPDVRYNEEVMQHLLAAFLHEMGDMYQKRIPVCEKKLLRNETLIRDLVHLILEHYRENRTVQFYAEQLCITPKYLSTTVKKCSGRTVSEWIDEAVMFEAKVQLRSTAKTVQQVSDYLNFPNPSFFGRYFKRHTGMTPKEYKHR